MPEGDDKKIDKEVTMQSTTEKSSGFVDRRQTGNGFGSTAERRQFGNSHSDLSPEARELAVAIDAYKVENRRRYITFEEMYQVISSLGYHK